MRNQFLLVLPALLSATSISCRPTSQHSFTLSDSTSSYQLLVGSYGGSPLTLFSLEPRSSYSLTNQSTIPSAGTGASWVSWDQSKSFFYSVNDHASASLDQHSIHAFSAIKDTSGQITGFNKLNVQASGGDGTVMVQRSRFPGSNCLYAANYGGKSATVINLNRNGWIDLAKEVINFTFKGSGPVSDRQDHSYPHEAIDSPDGRFVFVPDLGADQIHSFSLNSPTTCGLTQLPSVKTDAGDGPRHMEFYSEANNQTYAYVVTELSGVIRSYLVEDDGNLKLLKVQSARPSGLTKAEASKVAPSEAIISPDGKFLYVALRDLPHSGSNGTPGDAIAIFNRSTETGLLSGPTSFYHTGGRNPRHFSLSKDAYGSFIAVANQGDDNLNGKGQKLTILKRDAATGELDLVGGVVVDGTAFAGFI